MRTKHSGGLWPLIAGALMLGLVAACGSTVPSSVPTPKSSASAPATAAPSAPAVSEQPSTSTTEGPAGGACNLTSAAEVSAPFGAALDQSSSTSDDNWSYCTFATADGKGKVTILVSKTAIVADSLYPGAKADSKELITGVADEAFWDTGTQPGLWFKKGSTIVVVSPQGSFGALNNAHELATTLAKSIASRM